MTRFLQQAKHRLEAEKLVWEPMIVTTSQLEDLCAAHPELKVVDHFDGLIEELFHVTHPSLLPTSEEYAQQLEQYRLERSAENLSQWIYYPWLNTAVHVLGPSDHQLLRSTRNRNLITQDEQAKLGRCRVGVAGMSVGSSVVTALSLSNSYAVLRIGDADTIELSNLNRIKGGVQHLGLPKVTLAARGVYELDPFAKVEVWSNGITPDNLEAFMDDLDAIVDEVDDLAIKVQLRRLAQAKHLPVVMVTDDGDDSLLDVERFDQNPSQPIFHGLLSQSEIDQIEGGNLTKPEWLALSLRIIGVEYFSARLAASLPEVGRTVVGVPQMGGPSMIAGAIAAYAVRMILTNQPIKSGKTALPIEATLLSNYNEPRTAQHRKDLTAALRKPHA